MWGVLTGRTIRKFPLRKWMALQVTIWSFGLVLIALISGQDIPPNASSFMTVLVPAIIGVYGAGSSLEAIKGTAQKEDEQS